MSRQFASVESLQEKIDNELSWRKKEFSTLAAMIDKFNGEERRVIIRASIPILYAHWEGFIKQVSCAYWDHVRHQSTNRNLTCQDLKNNFLAIIFKGELNNSHSTNKHSVYLNSLDTILAKITDPAILPEGKKIINTKSNLNYETFQEIVSTLGFSEKIHLFELSARFIDEILLKKRNAIAHGEEEYLKDEQRGEAQDYKDIEKELIELMEKFSNVVLESAEDESYRRSSSQSSYALTT